MSFEQPHTSLGTLFLTQTDRYKDKVAAAVPNGRDFTEHTYGALRQMAAKNAGRLQRLGLSARSTIVLLGETGLDWSVLDWAAQTLGVIVVPIYPTLPADQVQYIAKDCGATIAFVQDEKQEAKLSGSGVACQPIACPADESPIDEQHWSAVAKEVHTDSVATYIYTSGTTGEPKGAELTHRGFLDLCANVSSNLPVDDRDVFLSWLPVAHVFERFAGHYLPVAIGAKFAYCSSMATLPGDMAKVKPTIMLAVPRFLESLKMRIEDGVAKKSPLQQKLFHWCLAQASAKRAGKFAPFASLLDSVVASKVRERTGGRLRYFVSGSAALPPRVSGFFLDLGIEVLQGYGLTETTAATSLNSPGDNRPHTVGKPFRGVEVKIAEDGEILIRGTSVMRGYHNLPEATAQAIDADGWFHSGDIGVIEDGFVQITDRKKDILVLANGKNVAPQRVEAKLKESPLLIEAVVFGDGMDHCIALLVPNLDRINALGLEGKAVEEAIRADVDRLNKELADYERVRKYRLLERSLSIEDGELTPSMKVKRKVVAEKYAGLLAEMSA